MTDVQISGKHVKITTNRGHTFLSHPDEPMYMPRRDYDEVIDWVRHWVDTKQFPRLEQLAHGDILPDPDSEMLDEESLDVLGADALYTALMAEDVQRVVSISPLSSAAEDFAFWLNLKSHRTGVRRRYMARVQQVIDITQAEAVNPLPNPSKELSLEDIPRHGPYRATDGREVYFYVHPFGRGRWPSDVPEYGSGASVTKPPPRSQMRAWKDWEYMGEPKGRHPRDPHHEINTVKARLKKERQQQRDD